MDYLLGKQVVVVEPAGGGKLQGIHPQEWICARDSPWDSKPPKLSENGRKIIYQNCELWQVIF
jgi:hypothetical protein